MKREIGLVVVFSLIVAAIATAASAGWLHARGSGGWFAAASQGSWFGYPHVSRVVDASFAVAPNESLEVRSSTFDVSFVRASGPTLRVHGTLSASSRAALDAIHVTSQESGGRRIVAIEGPSHGFFHFFDDHFTVEVPRVAALSAVSSSGDLQFADQAAPLNVATSSGDVTVTRAGTNAAIRTTSGDVVVSELGGDLQTQTSSGDVTVTRCGGATIRTKSGDVHVSGLRGALFSSSSSGDQRISLASGWAGSSLKINSASGDVDVAVPPDFRGTLGTSTAAGEVDNAAKLPSGAGTPALNITTSSGDITVHR